LRPPGLSAATESSPSHFELCSKQNKISTHCCPPPPLLRLVFYLPYSKNFEHATHASEKGERGDSLDKDGKKGDGGGENENDFYTDDDCDATQALEKFEKMNAEGRAEGQPFDSISSPRLSAQCQPMPA
jgi:hypothetical protein